MDRIYNIIIANEETGEIREFKLSRYHFRMLRRALNTYSAAPQWLRDRFWD